MSDSVLMLLTAGLLVAAGASVGWWLGQRMARGEAASVAARLEERSSALEGVRSDLDARIQESCRLRDDLTSTRETLARMTADLEGERERTSEKLAVLETATSRFREAFQALAAEALRSNQQSFLDLARAALGEFHKGAAADLEARQKAVGELVRPVEVSLKEVDSKLEALEIEREGAYRALRQQVESMAAAQEKLRGETQNLVQALRAPAVRGRWGEVHLKRVVELAGLREHCDFTEQETVTGEDGPLRPDLVVHLPGGKQVVVDAKVPLKAYLESLETSDEGMREKKLDEHARQVRGHMARLESKAYWTQFDDAPEFVVMFLPGEAFLYAACQRDPDLLEYGFEKHVLAVSPTNLISLLKTVHHAWQHQAITESAHRVRALGAELYDRLRTMTERLVDLGTHLDRAVRSYDQLGASFERRVLVSARKFREMGAAGSREIPEVQEVGHRVRELATSPTRVEEELEEGGLKEPQ